MTIPADKFVLACQDGLHEFQTIICCCLEISYDFFEKSLLIFTALVRLPAVVIAGQGYKGVADLRFSG